MLNKALIFVCLFIASLVLPEVFGANAPIKISLATKKKPASKKLAKYRVIPDLIVNEPMSKTIEATSRDVEVPLATDIGFSYVGGMEFGNAPNQVTMKMIFDSGSSDLWVPGTGCTVKTCQASSPKMSCDNNQCTNTGKTFFIQYGKGKTSGSIVEGNVAIGNLTGTGVDYGLASVATDISGADGIMGLAFAGISSIATKVNENYTVFDKMMKENNLENIVSFYLTDGKEGQSEMVIGGYDQSHFEGSLTNIKVESIIQSGEMAYWSFFSGVSVGGVTLASNVNTISDTGTSLVILTTSLFLATISELNNAKMNLKQGLYEIPCSSSQPDITFNVQGHSFVLTKADYTLELVPGQCLVTISSSSQPLIILGDTFIRKYYQVYAKPPNSDPYIGMAVRSGSGPSPASSTSTAQPTATAQPTSTSSTSGPTNPSTKSPGAGNSVHGSVWFAGLSILVSAVIFM
eukprot:Nk52_evm82s554 gene=Nk52_evmTU82s554